MRFQAGELLGPYVVREPLGAGAMGEVYRASDPRLGRDVAIKVLLAEPDSERLVRFEREARAAAMLVHPNIVTVFDVGAQDGHPFLVTELLDGRTLRDELVSRQTVAPTVAFDLAIQLARGVAAAHALKIVHRDLKPENLFLTRSGALKILDFGLAKLRPDISDASALATLDASQPGGLIGTPAYMSPEQLRGEPVDERADIFAIGVILYELLTGAHPFRRPSAVETLSAILREAPGRGAEPASVPLLPAVQRVLTRCLEKQRSDRFQHASDLTFALELLLGDLRRDGTAAPVPPAIAGQTSIAVLPFADMSPGRDQDYLCDGIADELITALTHVDGLRVAARSSSFQFRASAADVRAIGARLGVSSVLEGSVRKIGDRLRVTVQLVDVSDGFYRWSERYDQPVEEVFAIQDQIAERIATALRGVLSPHERDALRRPETAVECYEFFLRARRLLNQFDHASLITARGLMERALEIDPKYAPAHAALGEVHAWLYEWWGGTHDDYEAADRSTEVALALAPRLAEAHAARGFVLSLSSRYDEAGAEFEAAIRLNPNLFEAHYLYGRSAFAAGRIERSAELFLRAAAVRREDFQSLMLGAQSLLMLGRREEALEVNREGIRRAERHLDLDPGDARALSIGAGALQRDGRQDEALRWSARALELHPDDQGVLINAACVHARAGLKEEAIALLERSFAKGFGKRDWIEHDPDYDNLRDDQRFQSMLAKLR
jgi:serine/threonine protein kinase/tetratricopeptide (TPR) repeat protein